ncbi:MAG: ABC transporter permease [Acidimicrobiia bacterium]|nr:ABC transporter permease [Acidimicrobiia bacterium]
METFFQFFIVFALQAAGIYAVAASGLVVTYATSGVFNFAHGAIGMFCAFSYWELSQNRGWPSWIALVVVLFVEAPLIGLVLDRVIMRRLADASTITTIVVTIGLLVAFVQLAGMIWPQGSTTRVLPEFFVGDTVKVFGINVSYHAVIVLITAILVAVVLRVLLYETRLGVAMRAVVDNRELGALNGVHPDRISSVSWMLGSMLAALAGVLIAPILPQFTPVALTLLVISAYAAAMVGRLRSLPLTFLGAVILGEFESLLNWIDTKGIGGHTVADVANDLQTSAPVILLFVVLILLPQDRVAGRSSRRYNAPTPSLRTMAMAMVAYVAGAYVIAQSGWVSKTTVDQLGVGIALGIVMLSLVLLTGYGGQVSLAQPGFAGIGALVVWKMGPVGGLVAGVVICAAVGVLVALPALKMRDLYLALSTMAFALFLETNIYGENALFKQFLPFSVGNASVRRIPGLEGDTAFFMVMAVAFALIVLLLTVIRNGSFGRRLQAMRDSPSACVTLGLDLTATKLQAFGLAAAIAGLGGALLAMWKETSVGVADFSLLKGPLPGLPLVLVAVVFGITTAFGAVIGGPVFVLLPLIGTWYPALENIMNLAPGLAGIGLGQNPDGAVGQVAESFARDEPSADHPPPPPRVPVVPERVGAAGRPTAEEIRELDDVLGLSWGRCETKAAPR